MRIAYVGGTKNYMDYFINELRKLRHEVMINDCDKDCDVILCENRNQWSAARAMITEFPHIPLICWNWDWYEYLKGKDGKFINTVMFGQADNYLEFDKLIKESFELWSVSPETGENCEKDLGVKSKFFYKYFCLPWEWEGEKKDYGYIVQASRDDPNKRFKWYEKAAEELDIPYKSCHPPGSAKRESNSREDYIRTMKNCRFNVLASREESGGGTSSIEASFCKKPVLVSDNGGAKFMWEDDVWYFKKDDYEDFKSKMKWLWENYNSPEVKEKTERAYQRVCKMFFPEHFAKRISDRLELISKNSSKR